MVAPVAEQGDAIDQPPAKQFLDRIGNVRAREAEHFGDLLGMERTVGNEEQSMDLRDRAIDAPLPAAIAPVQNELGRRGGPFWLSFLNFCPHRNIGCKKFSVKCLLDRSVFLVSAGTHTPPAPSAPI